MRMAYDARLRLRSYLEDGLLEMTIALAFIGLSAWFLIEELIFMAWMLPWMFVTVIHPAMKKKLVAPRGGMVEFPKPTGRRRYVIMVALGLSVLALFGLVVATGAQRDATWFQPVRAAIQWLAEHFPLALGIAMAVVLAKLGMRGMTPRLVLLAGLSLVAGLLSDLLVPGSRMGALAASCAAGIPLLFVGYVTYRRYARTHPVLGDNLAV